MMHELIVENLNFRYEKATTPVLKDISLKVKKGEWLTILGHNGSGKSTLAKFFNALHVPTEGKVISCGMNTANVELWPEIRRNVAMVFQNPDNQMIAPTVEDDIAFGLENAGIPYESMRKRVHSSIERLGLVGLEKQEPHRLSGGQKQRVALAGAIALHPKVIILDEATSMLDPRSRQEVLSAVHDLQFQEGLTVVMITHDVNEALLSDRIVVLKEGQVIQEGTPKEILTDQKTMHHSHLSVPFVVEIADELRKKHVYFPENVLTHEELVFALCKYKQEI